MEFNDVIKNRYSCKKYSEKEVEDNKINAILEAGRLAPTAKNLQEQHIYVVKSGDGSMNCRLFYIKKKDYLATLEVVLQPLPFFF